MKSKVLFFGNMLVFGGDDCAAADQGRVTSPLEFAKACFTPRGAGHYTAKRVALRALCLVIAHGRQTDAQTILSATCRERRHDRRRAPCGRIVRAPTAGGDRRAALARIPRRLVAVRQSQPWRGACQRRLSEARVETST